MSNSQATTTAGTVTSLSAQHAAWLEALARLHGHEGRAHELMRLADQELTGKTIEEIFEAGLHQFLLAFIVRNREVASAIAEQFRFTA